MKKLSSDITAKFDSSFLTESDLDKQGNQFSLGRIYFFYGFLIICFLLLIGRLFELQIILGARNRILAEENRIKKEIIPAPRGMITDRQARPLVKNKPVYRLKKENCDLGKGDCFEEISREESLRIEAVGGEKAADLRLDVGRDYLYGQALAHVLGYLGEASEEEVRKVQWQLGDLVGRTGIEEKYEQTLRGQDGGVIYEVDTTGNRVREIGRTESLPGQDLQLSLDAQLSRVAYEALEGRLGAVVASEVKTGQVIVLGSSPSFDPNQIKFEDLISEAKPMFNRAIGGVYPPGSTFKIVTATAGIESGKVDEKTVYEDQGFIQIGDYIYKNWYYTQYGRTEGEIGLVRAIKRSTDTFFYKIGEWVGATKLAEWGKAFGLGRETGIDLKGEVSGLVPNPEWKEKTIGERWFLGNTYHFAIGQADLLTTPLQVNMMASVIANNGNLCSPKIKQEEKVRDCLDLKLKPETLKLIKEGMKEACSPEGTAFPFFDFNPQVGCKTGTAEFGDPEGKTHAWLTAFAPVDNPEILVTALFK